jgi:hypothetical protein
MTHDRCRVLDSHPTHNAGGIPAHFIRPIEENPEALRFADRQKNRFRNAAMRAERDLERARQYQQQQPEPAPEDSDAAPRRPTQAVLTKRKGRCAGLAH